MNIVQYQVIDSHTQLPVGGTSETLRRASRKAERLNQEYGACRSRVEEEVNNYMSNDPESALMATDGEGYHYVVTCSKAV